MTYTFGVGFLFGSRFEESAAALPEGAVLLWADGSTLAMTGDQAPFDYAIGAASSLTIGGLPADDDPQPDLLTAIETAAGTRNVPIALILDYLET